jgi:hypothetical protein
VLLLLLLLLLAVGGAGCLRLQTNAEVLPVAALAAARHDSFGEGAVVQRALTCARSSCDSGGARAVLAHTLKLECL